MTIMEGFEEVDDDDTGSMMSVDGEGGGEVDRVLRKDEDLRRPREWDEKAEERVVEEARWRAGGGGGERPWQLDMNDVVRRDEFRF